MRIALVTALTLLTLSAQAAPITTTYNVQFISVCNGGGGDCAPVPVPTDPANPARDLNNHLDVLNRIYEQAGIRFAPVMAGNQIDIKHVNNTALQNPTLTVDPALNTVISADGFSELTRGAHLQSIGVSPSSSTLNIFYVNDLRPVDTNGAAIPNAALRGVGWLNGNGVIVDKEARLDTLAHEIGHNLGLNHFADPKNIMASGDSRRPITTTINDVAPNGQQLDQLNAAQGADARGPLFANGTARVVSDEINGTAVGNLNSGVFSATRFYNFDFETTPSDRRLAKIQFYYDAGTEVDFRTPGQGTKTVTPTSIILEHTFATPLAPGDEFQLNTWLGRVVVLPVGPNGEVDTDPAYADHPLFVRYIFDNGVASQALFDEDGPMASDDPTNQFLFVGTPVPDDRPLALQGNEIEIAIEVPEPHTLALFGSALVLLTLSRRRKADPLPATRRKMS
jgi:hypothetical protein